jgi:putative Mg2+ transporter-C (MgtC) family protein
MTTYAISGDAVVRLLAALVCGALVGLEREANDQPAGLRTHVAVCMGAALFGVISTLGFLDYEKARAATNIQIDVTRVASQVVVGIGFLGAGMIFRQGTAVRNLTTAASLWVVSAIGLASGIGHVGDAAVGTVLLLGSLVLLRPLRSTLRRLTRGNDAALLRVTLADGADPSVLLANLAGLALDLSHVATEKHDGRRVLVVSVSGTGEAILGAQSLLVSSADTTDVQLVEGSGGGIAPAARPEG